MNFDLHFSIRYVKFIEEQTNILTKSIVMEPLLENPFNYLSKNI